MHCLRDLSQDTLKAKSSSAQDTFPTLFGWYGRAWFQSIELGCLLGQKYFRSGGKIDNPSISFRQNGQVFFAA